MHAELQWASSDIEAWNNLFLIVFHPIVMLVPWLQHSTNNTVMVPILFQHYLSKTKFYDPLMSLAARVSATIEEVDFKGAIRLVCSDGTMAD